MTTSEPDLKTLIRRLDKRNERRKAGVALVASSGVLGLVVLFAPLLNQKEAAQLAEAPVSVMQPVFDTYQGVTLEGKAAIVYDLTTHEILFARNAKSQLPLASLTKLLTMYAASETLSDGTKVTITDAALASDGDSGFTAGETFAFGDLARLALVSSSNDATAAISDTASGLRATSGKNMLAGVAAAMGLAQTYALNGTGLDESTSISGAYGSAYDVATLAGALIEKAPDLARATIEPSITIRSTEGVSHTLANTNPDVANIPGLLLSKTGFTDLAGGNLAVVFDAGVGHPVAVVVLGSSREGRFRDVETLIDLTLERFAGINPAS